MGFKIWVLTQTSLKNQYKGIKHLLKEVANKFLPINKKIFFLMIVFTLF